MPQASKKRGRRAGGLKRKHEDGDDEAVLVDSSKRRKSTDADQDQDGMPIDVQDEAVEGAYPSKDRPFFGMLDDEEQEYFKRADDMLESNAFGDQEERTLFLSNVYREADGKELKLAQSQSCSRLMERLIQSSTSSQLKNLFQKFSGNFIHLMSHRFASHCCEALLQAAAPFVTEELLGQAPHDQRNGGPLVNGDAVHVSMENLYLHVLAELEGSVGYLLTDRYASHVLRVLLLVLSGEPIDTAVTKHLLQSKRKEANAVQGVQPSDVRSLSKSRTVPDSFSDALGKLIADSVAGLNTDKLRALATHPNGSPLLQLMLKLELAHYGKQRAKDQTSIIRTLLPDDPITATSESGAFINGLVYDPVGSHLVENIVENAPGKIFKNLYSEFFKDKLVSHSRNEVAGFVVCRVLERLGHDDLLEAHEMLVPVVTELLHKGRTVVVRTLIERCTVRGIDTQAVAVQVNACWDTPEGFEVTKLLKFGEEAENEAKDTHESSASEPAVVSGKSMEPVKAHFNILAQAMLLVPGSLSSLVLDSLIDLDPQTLLNMSKDHIVSRTLQAALTSRNSSLITTRKLIQHFYGHMGEMALDSAASHVVDCIWEGTHGLAFIRERIAEELAENEAQLRESACGRAVWKNWKMDLYKRRRADWIRQSKIKASNDGFQSFSELDAHKEKESPAKTPLQIARERHAKDKKKKERSKVNTTRNTRPGAPTAGATPAAATAST